MIETIRRGDIYLVDFSGVSGSEQSGIRPAIVVQNEAGNIHSPTTIVCPITSKQKTELSTHVSLTPSDGVIKDSTVLCEQVRVIDKARMKKRLGKIISRQAIEEINQRLMISLGIIGE